MRNPSILLLLYFALILLVLACNKGNESEDNIDHKPFEKVDSIQLAGGELYRVKDFDSKYVSPRHIDVWQPQDFDPQDDYQILWMHDGQMLFDKSKTWNKQEWGIDENLTKLIEAGKIPPTLVVATWNVSENRHADYFPEKPYNNLDSLQKEQLLNYNKQNSDRLFQQSPNADDYLKFLVQEVKPMVEKSFQVNVNKTNTTVAGSSMGGLISFYALAEYPRVFGNAICMSTHWPGGMPFKENPFPEAFFHYLDNKLPGLKTHKFYFDFGTATLDELYPQYQKPVDSLFAKNGFGENRFKNLKFEGHKHHEEYWFKRIGNAVLFTSKSTE